MGDDRATHNHFADFAAGEFAGVGEGGDGAVDDGDNADVDAGDGTADAGAAGCGGIDFAGGNGGDRQGFRGAVGAVELAAREKGGGRFPEGGGHGGTGAEHAAERRERNFFGDAVIANLPPECGGAEGIGDVFLADGLDDFCGVDLGGAARVDLGDDRRHAQRGVEESEDREERKVDFAGLDRVGLTDEADLSVEHTVFVADALGCAGGARGKQDGGEFAGRTHCRLVHELRVEA